MGDSPSTGSCSHFAAYAFGGFVCTIEKGSFLVPAKFLAKRLSFRKIEKRAEAEGVTLPATRVNPAMSKESVLQVAMCSVQSDAHPAANVLTPEMYRAWQVRVMSPRPPLRGFHARSARERTHAAARGPDVPPSWAQFKGSNVGSIILKILPPSPIFSVMLANAGSQYVEVVASASSDGADDWECIIPRAMLRTEAEIKEGKARERPRTYTTENGLKKFATESVWARIKVTCSW